MTGFEIAPAQMVRIAPFFVVFSLMAIWELVAARRKLCRSRSRRWTANLSVFALDILVPRLLLPAAEADIAIEAAKQGWGALAILDAPPWVRILAALVILDFAIYLQHRLFHAVPALWRVHMVHHADVDFDVTTGVRFHPIEILISLGLKAVVIVLLGAPVEGVLLFAVILNASSLFNHGNVRLPDRLDGWLRWVVVTPDMHRVHHSVECRETNSNFGFNLPWWDRLCGTYVRDPVKGHEQMEIGLAHVAAQDASSLVDLLTLPFRASAGTYTDRPPGGKTS
ncbi:MAG: sterol desaturase family protein [Acidobacteriota bacterium]|nr:sterol desaturase family protein [Acidobacteriota bacterium]